MTKTNSSIAREASKRIVEDLLMTAGAGHDTEEEDSPSMVKMQDNILDDSF
jgi:DASH complex subunit ASK1